MQTSNDNISTVSKKPFPEYNVKRLKSSAEDLGLSSSEDLHYFPKLIAIENISSCNARCLMCPIDELTRSHKLMRQSVFDKIIEDIKPYASWLERVTLPILGEPLIDKKIEQKIKTLKNIGIKNVHLTSNASLMTENRSISLIESGLDAIDYSIDGASPEVFQEIRKRLHFDECVKNIESFIKVRNELNPNIIIRIRMTVSETNSHEFSQFKEFWTERLGEQDLVYGKLLHNWGNGYDKLNTHKQVDDNTLNNLMCVSPWLILNINSDGRVPLCCVDFNAEEDFGNVANDSIANIGRSDRSRSIREGHGRDGRNSLTQCVGCYAWEPSLEV